MTRWLYNAFRDRRYDYLRDLYITKAAIVSGDVYHSFVHDTTSDGEGLFV